MKQEFLVESVSKEELLKEIDKLIKKNFAEFLKPPPADEDVLWTREQCSDYLKITLPTLHEWIKNGILKTYKIGNKIRFKKAEVKAAIIPQSNIRRKRLKDIKR